MKYLFLLFTFMFSAIGFSQEDSTVNEYPKYIFTETDTFVVFTMEQAQKIDNDYELLVMLEDLADHQEIGDSAFIKVINDQEQQIALLKVEVEALKDVGDDKDTVISKLNDQIELYKSNEEKYEQELVNKDKIIEEKDKQIKKHKRQKLFGGIGGGAAIITLVVLLLIP
ncbi:MAG: hypothetical protein SLAVMIC_00336 [uncultured marine phage]|uniref:Uncharacterized protein n=1 Tax=uncultured marine phage TaxID=707152 RepID=A0A8D9CF02_9VIRU|nr:MAG: hypothetical protein SLAVMIC_00336 [uncultured marine phage]